MVGKLVAPKLGWEVWVWLVKEDGYCISEVVF